jgi:hypothetical protein
MTANDNGQPRWQIETSHVLATIAGVAPLVVGFVTLPMDTAHTIGFVGGALVTIGGLMTALASKAVKR